MRKWLMTFLSLLLMTGCVDKEILDDISLEVARSYDWLSENQVEGTTLIYSVLPDKAVKNTTITTTASSTREVFQKLQRQAPDPLAEGSIELFLFGKELARAGLIDYLDAPLRNASIGARPYLITVDGNAKELIQGKYGSTGNAIFISNLLKHNIKSENLPKTNLHLFINDYYQLGKTGYLPQLKKVSEELVELNGISLFGTDKISEVDTIEWDKMFFFKLLVDNFSEGSIKVQRGKDEALIRNLISKNKMKLTKRNPYAITVNIELEGIVREYTGHGSFTDQVIRQYEKELEKQIKTECETMIKRFQDKGIDPIGFGFFIKTRTRGFKIDENWETGDVYKNLSVKVVPNVKILESGVIE
jgi:spore germination protein